MAIENTAQHQDIYATTRTEFYGPTISRDIDSLRLSQTDLMIAVPSSVAENLRGIGDPCNLVGVSIYNRSDKPHTYTVQNARTGETIDTLTVAPTQANRPTRKPISGLRATSSEGGQDFFDFRVLTDGQDPEESRARCNIRPQGEAAVFGTRGGAQSPAGPANPEVRQVPPAVTATPDNKPSLPPITIIVPGQPTQSAPVTRAVVPTPVPAERTGEPYCDDPDKDGIKDRRVVDIYAPDGSTLRTVEIPNPQDPRTREKLCKGPEETWGQWSEGILRGANDWVWDNRYEIGKFGLILLAGYGIYKGAGWVTGGVSRTPLVGSDWRADRDRQREKGNELARKQKALRDAQTELTAAQNAFNTLRNTTLGISAKETAAVTANSNLRAADLAARALPEYDRLQRAQRKLQVAEEGVSAADPNKMVGWFKNKTQKDAAIERQEKAEQAVISAQAALRAKPEGLAWFSAQTQLQAAQQDLAVAQGNLNTSTEKANLDAATTRRDQARAALTA